MTDFLHCILAVLVMFICEQGFVNADCSDQTKAGTALKACLTDVGFNLDMGVTAGMGAMGNMEQTKAYCRDKKFDRAVKCVEDLRDVCKTDNPEVTDALDRLVNIEQLKASFRSICDNINAVERNAQCIGQQSQDLSTCIQKETQNFQKKIQAMQATGQFIPNSVQALSCEFIDKMIDCQRTSLKPCGKEVVRFMTSFLQAFIPTGCSTSKATTTPESVTTEVPGSNKTRNDIECGSDYIRLSIPATLLHPGRTARLRDPSCTVTVSGGKVTAQFNLRECGTMAHFTDRYIVYKNELTVDSSLADPSTSDFSIPIECSYPRSNTLTLSYMPVHRKVKVYEKNFGSLDISMKQYYSNNFANLYDDSAYPVDMELTKNVYMSIGVNHPESSKLAMFPMMCLANGSPSPWGSTLSHELIKDGCKEDQSVVMYPGDNPAEVRFSFNAFQFSQRIGPVYVHCDVLLCRASNTSSRCAAGCLSQSARRKRSAVEVSSLHDGHFVSGGPFHFNSRPDGKVPALVFVAGVVAAVSMLVAIVAVSVAGITLRLRTQRMVESGDFRK